MWFRRKRRIEAEEFVLADRQGRERAAFRLDPSENPEMAFKDPVGNVRMTVALEDDGTPVVELHYAEGQGSVRIEANTSTANAGMVIRGPSGYVQVVLGVARNGLPAVGLFDEWGMPIVPMQAENIDHDAGAPPTGFDWDSILRD